MGNNRMVITIADNINAVRVASLSPCDLHVIHIQVLTVGSVRLGRVRGELETQVAGQFRGGLSISNADGIKSYFWNGDIYIMADAAPAVVSVEAISWGRP